MDVSPLLLSVWVAACATFFSVVLGTLAAYGVMKLRRLRPFADAVLTLPLVLPPTVTGFFLLILLGKNSPVGRFFNEIGFPFIFSLRGAVAAAFVVSFPLMYRAVRGAMESMDKQLLYAARTLGASEKKIFFRIILPYAMADILVGMRIGLGYSWRAIIGAEMVAASTGLGHMILFAQQMSRTDKVIVGILAIGAVGYVTDRLFGWMIGFVLKGSGENGWN